MSFRVAAPFYTPSNDDGEGLLFSQHLVLTLLYTVVPLTDVRWGPIVLMHDSLAPFDVNLSSRAHLLHACLL